MSRRFLCAADPDPLHGISVSALCSDGMVAECLLYGLFPDI